MDRHELLSLLGEVGDRLATRSVTARVYIVGGAAMALAYDADRATRDIDGLILEGHGPLTEAVREVGRAHGLPETWLNEQASAYVPSETDRAAMVVFDHPALRVLAASPERLLALKVLAARRTDLGDIKRLADMLGLGSAHDLKAVFRSVFPDDELPRRSALLIEDLFG